MAEFALCSSLHCHLSTYEVSKKYLEGLWGCALDKFILNFVKGQLLWEQTWKSYEHCSLQFFLLSSIYHQISSQYNEQSLSNAMDKIYTKRAITNRLRRFKMLAHCTSPHSLLCTYEALRQYLEEFWKYPGEKDLLKGQ